jgi:TPR repeat protein
MRFSAQFLAKLEAKLIRIAAARGEAEAQNNLGVMYANGRGVPQDYAEAVSWFRKAAEQGHASGRGVPQDYAEAVSWFRKAAEQGHASAQHNLGSMYLNGVGVRQDFDQSYAWFNLAAARGFRHSAGLSP